MNGLLNAIAAVPAGAWAVGVSGGADSVALVTLLARYRPDCRLLIVHLDHHLRGEESDEDASFVRRLGDRLHLPVAVARREAIEGTADRLSTNPSARYRAVRLMWFAEVVRHENLDGVLLAHHADDVAETVLLRLLRGGGLTNLGGVRGDNTLPAVRAAQCRLRIVRPLLAVRRDDLHAWLRSIHQPWREDSSNASPAYRRNVVRRVLAANPFLVPLLLGMAEASQRLRDTLDVAAPRLGTCFATRDLRAAPLLARHAAGRWLADHGVPVDRVTNAVCDRLIAQATDVTRPPRQHYPGGVLVRRRAGRVDVIGGAAVQSPHDHGQETDAAPEL